jgi:hypothetical protein
MPDGNDGPDVDYLNNGFTFLLNDNFQIDFRVGAGLDDLDSNYYIGSGFCYRIDF